MRGDSEYYREPAGHRQAGPGGRYRYAGPPRHRPDEPYPYREPDRHRRDEYREADRRRRGDYREADRHRHDDDREPAGYRHDEYHERQDPAPWDYWDDEEAAADYGHAASATGGAEGNARLTGLTGMALLILFAAEGFTILGVRQMLTLHFFLGMLLIGPVLLKLCSTIYRFTRYYTGDAEYRRKGPPALPMRILGPFVILTSLAVIGTGVMLALTGPGSSIWLLAHKASFVLWFGVMTIHVLAYVWRLPRLVGSDVVRQAGYRADQVLSGRAARWLLLTASLLTGLLLAVITVHLAGSWTTVPGPGR